MEKTDLCPDDAALKVLAELKNIRNKIEAQIGLETICVLGNHEAHLEEMEKIVETLNKANYRAIYLKGIPQEEKLPDYLTEKIAINKSSVILVIDNPRGGVVGECTYIMENPELADKTILLVEDIIPEADTLGLDKHYRYFREKVRFKNSELVGTAVRAAKQATHRLAERKITKKDDGAERNGI